MEQLTGAATKETELLLYVQCKNKLDLKNKLPLKYAKQIKQKILPLLFLEKVYHPERLHHFDFDLPYMMKYKGILTPVQMKEDIIFTEAHDRKDHQEVIIKW